jgi:hypothetical protein
MAKENCGECNSNKISRFTLGLRSGLRQSGGRFAAGLDAGLKRCIAWMQRQRQQQKQKAKADPSAALRNDKQQKQLQRQKVRGAEGQKREPRKFLW